MASAKTRIDQARWWALTHEPFYGSLAMSLTDVIDPSIDTACTDGKTIHWNPDFVLKHTDAELRFLLLHETLHCAHQHLWRLPADDKGNQAGDHAINLTLQNVPGISMPERGLADPQYKGLSEEEIYRRLPDEEEGDGGGGAGGQPGDGSQGGGSGKQQGGGGKKPDVCGTFTKPAANTPDPGDAGSDPAAAQSQQQLRDQWEIKVMQAAQAAQASGQGTVPADMDRLLRKMRRQDVDWRQEMAEFTRNAQDNTRNDYSRPARRHAWQPVIYPRKRCDGLATVIFARDTSGSVNNKTLAEYSALISDCVSELGCHGLVVDCDARIQAEYEIEPFDECPLNAKGGGGTDFRPVFERADELMEEGEDIAGVVYLTDMAGTFPEMSDIPTLWLATRDHAAPKFGRMVRIPDYS